MSRLPCWLKKITLQLTLYFSERKRLAFLIFELINKYLDPPDNLKFLPYLSIGGDGESQHLYVYIFYFLLLFILRFL